MIQTAHFIFRESDWNRLSAYLLEKPNLESGAYAVFKTSTNPNTIRFLVNQIIIPRDSDYYRRSPSAVAFTPGFTESAFRKCEKTRSHLLDIHTHPWSESVQFSGIDDHEAMNTKIPYMIRYLPKTIIAFIVFGNSTDIAQARFWDNGTQRLLSVSRIIVI